MTEQLIYQVKQFEGLRTQSYLCPAGVWTIGYGHTGKVNGINLSKGVVITEKQAEELLRADLLSVEKNVMKTVAGIALKPGQIDALIDFVFNLGIGNLLSSTLLKKIKKNVADPTISNEIRRWVFCKNKKLQGLVVRRNWEARRWCE